MADLEAELARFEAEVDNQQAQALPGPPGPPSFPPGASQQQGHPQQFAAPQGPAGQLPPPPPVLAPPLQHAQHTDHAQHAPPAPATSPGPSAAPMQHAQQPWQQQQQQPGQYPAGSAAMHAPRPGMPLPGAFLTPPRPMPLPTMAPFPGAAPAYQPAPAPYSLAAQMQHMPPAYVPAYTNPNPTPGGASSTYYAAPQQYVPPPAAQHSMNDAATQEKLAGIKAAVASQDKEKKQKPKAIPRSAAGEKWWDPTLVEWPENDFRIFVGDLGNEVNDEILAKAFNKYSTFAKAKIVRDKRTNKSRGYGFVSLMDAVEGARCLREMNGKYIGNRPCKLRKSTWQERTPEHMLKGNKRKGEGGGGAPAKKAGVLHR